MKKQNVRTLSLIVGTFTYLLIGAAIFDSIESEEEQRQMEALEALEAQLLSKYNINRVDFVLLEQLVLVQQPYKAGMPWQFAGSFYYATTVLTTIGYGHSTPKTDFGKFFTMAYATIGIPLGLVMFNSIGERLNNFASIVINKLRKMVKARKPETTETDLILVAGTLTFIVATCGAAVFSHYEEWSYLHAIYYGFTTLTTIGFGDYVALQQDNSLQRFPEYVTFVLVFIMFGLAFIACVLNLMVLKFLTLNTEDERRDENEAFEAAARSVRLDGDVILQQSEVLHWQAEGAGSMVDIRSVCSCTCQSCNPFQQINLRSHEDFAATAMAHSSASPAARAARAGGGGGGGKRWFSQSSVLSSSETRETQDSEDRCCDCDYRSNQANSKLHSRRERRRNKAESIHDLRASSVSSKLKVPPSWTPPPTARSTLLRIPPLTPSPVAPTPTPATLSDAAPGNAIELTELTSGGRRRRKGGPRRPTDEVQDSQAALIRQSFAEGFSVHRHTCSAAVAARQQLEEYEDKDSEQRRERRQRLRRRRRLLRRFLQWPPRLIELPPGYDPDGGGGSGGVELATERRECYMGLDTDVETMKVVPVSENCNRHKRVSL